MNFIFNKYSMVTTSPCVITYYIFIRNISTTTFTNLVFKDSIPVGLSFIPSSFTINGIVLPTGNPLAGASIAKISPDEYFFIRFKAAVTTSLPTSYTNLAFLWYSGGTQVSNILTTMRKC